MDRTVSLGGSDELHQDGDRERGAGRVRLRPYPPQSLQRVRSPTRSSPTSACRCLILTLFYGEHRGDKELRALIAAQDAGVSPDDVLVTAGAAVRCSSSRLRFCRRTIISSSSGPTTPPSSKPRGNRLRHRLCVDLASTKLRHRCRTRQGGDPAEHQADQRHLPAQPDRHDDEPG